MLTHLLKGQMKQVQGQHHCRHSHSSILNAKSKYYILDLEIMIRLGHTQRKKKRGEETHNKTYSEEIHLVNSILGSKTRND